MRALETRFQPSLQSFVLADGDAQAALVVEQLIEARRAHTPLSQEVLAGTDGSHQAKATTMKISRRWFLGFILVGSEKRVAVLENLPGVFDIYTELQCKIK